MSGATAYDCPVTNETYILVFHESLYYGTGLDHTLINPNQVRYNGIPFWDNPFDEERGLCVHASETLFIPLQMKGSKIHFASRSPTNRELHECPRIEMTSRSPWDPKNVQLSPVDRMVSAVSCTPVGTSNNGCVVKSISTEFGMNPHRYMYDDDSSYFAALHRIDPSLCDLKQLMLSQVISNGVEVYDMLDKPEPRTVVQTKRHSSVTPQELSEVFGIGHIQAQRTLHATTQRGMRSAILPLSRRYRADRILQEKRLAGKFATDTLYYKLKSVHQNVAAQVYSHKCGFTKAYQLTRVNGECVGDSLGDFVSDFGIPDHLTFDGAKVQVGNNTKFKKTIRKHDIKWHVSSPYRPNENPAESAIRELKKKWFR